MREQEEGCILFSTGLGSSRPIVWLLAALWHALFLARGESRTNGQSRTVSISHELWGDRLLKDDRLACVMYSHGESRIRMK
jgi:hypothetical protein